MDCEVSLVSVPRVSKILVLMSYQGSLGKRPFEAVGSAIDMRVLSETAFVETLYDLHTDLSADFKLVLNMDFFDDEPLLEA